MRTVLASNMMTPRALLQAAEAAEAKFGSVPEVLYLPPVYFLSSATLK